MSPHDPVDRRTFLAGTAALAMTPIHGLFAQDPAKPALPYEFCTFTKPVQNRPAGEIAAKLAAMGFQGIEAPVRPKGQVEPGSVEEDLPKLVEALKKEGLVITVLTSGINEVSDEQHTEKVLRTAAALGIKRFRMSYFNYDLKKPILPQLDEIRPRIADLVAFCRETGIKPVYQNHSGRDYFGGPIWDLAKILSDHDPADIGVAFDIGHATVEGAKAWPLNFAVIRPWLDTVYIKEPAWHDNKLGWGAIGEGAVDKGFYKLLKDDGFSGPVSVHVEYLDAKGGEDNSAEVFAAIERDFATVRSYLS